MAARKNLKKNSEPVPQNLYEAEAVITKIHLYQIELERLEANAKKEIGEYETAIEEVKKRLKAEGKYFEDEIQRLSSSVHTYAVAHKEELIEESGKKTIDLTTGDKFRWYLARKSVCYENEEEAIRELEQKGLGEAVRIVKEVNKEYLLRSPETVEKLETISFLQEEIFEIILSSIGLALEKGKRKFKRKSVY